MVDFISWFSNSKLFSRELVTRKQLFEGYNSRFLVLCSTVTHLGQHKIFLHNPPLFQHLFSWKPLYQSLDKELTRSISPIQANLLSTWDLLPATTWTENPSRKGILPNDMVSWEVFPLQKSKCLVKSNPGYRMVSMCLHTHPQLIIPGPILLGFPAARSSSNSSSNIPRCDANELIIFPPPSKDYFHNTYSDYSCAETTTIIFPAPYYYLFLHIIDWSAVQIDP